MVLSVGMEPSASMADLSERLGIELNEFGFCKTDRLLPLSTSGTGVFVGGAFQEPKDIPETVTQASAAASMAMELLAPARHSLVTRKSYPDEHDISDEDPRIGVFVCHCGMNIASVVDVERVVKNIENHAPCGIRIPYDVHLFGYEFVEHQGDDPGTPPEPHRGGLLHPADP